MKCFRGWLLGRNIHTKKMVPFFVRVRSEDIYPTDAINPDEVLQPTSTRWTVSKAYNQSHHTIYYYTQSFDFALIDPFGEEIPSSYLDAVVRYDFDKDGILTVDGHIRVSGEKLTGLSKLPDTTNEVYKKQIYLPYALPTHISPGYWVNADCEYGHINNMSFVAKLGRRMITNTKINPNHTDTKEYPFAIEIYQSREIVNGHSPIWEYKELVDSNSEDIGIYTERSIPIHFHYDGFWKE